MCAGDEALAVVENLMGTISDAEERMRARLERDLASIAALEPEPRRSPAAPEAIASKLSGRTDVERRVLAMLAYRMAEAGAGAEQAAQLAERALGAGRMLAADPGSPELLAAGMALGLAGRTEAAERLFGAIVGQALKDHSQATVAASYGQRGVERYRRGALPEALSDLRAGVDAAKGQPWETVIDDCRAHLLRARADRCGFDEAERDLEAWAAIGPLPETSFGHRLLIERARLRLQQGRLEEARIDLDAVSSRLADRDDSIMFEWRSPAALTHHRLGDRQSALELAHAELERARAWGAARQLGIASATLGWIEGGRPGLERIHAAVEVLEGSCARLEHARALFALGDSLRRAGEAHAARSQLRVGLELAASCGAAAVAKRAARTLIGVGARRQRPPALYGIDALTPSERRVASMAATGLSNPDIASALVVTRKTVELHLGNAYRKLQINSRAQLRAALSSGQLA